MPLLHLLLIVHSLFPLHFALASLSCDIGSTVTGKSRWNSCPNTTIAKQHSNNQLIPRTAQMLQYVTSHHHFHLLSLPHSLAVKSPTFPRLVRNTLSAVRSSHISNITARPAPAQSAVAKPEKPTPSSTANLPAQEIGQDGKLQYVL